MDAATMSPGSRPGAKNVSFREPVSEPERGWTESDVESCSRPMSSEADAMSMPSEAVASQLARLQAECEGWRAQAERLAERLTVERWQKTGAEQDCAAGADEVARRRAHQKEQEGALQLLASATSGAASAAGSECSYGRLPSAPSSIALSAPPVECGEDLLAGDDECGGGGAGPAHARAEAGAWSFPGRWAARAAALRARATAAGWLISPSELSLGASLGEGAFGETRRARWRGADVAVKCGSVSSDIELGSFLREIEIFSSLRHPSIVPFLGFVLEGADRCWVVTEYMSGGPLGACVYASCKGGATKSFATLAPSERLQRALELAGALAAMHACSPPLLHRDIKPNNVLIDGCGRVRLADFGLARAFAGEGVMTGETGSYLYMSPEVMRHEPYGPAADVWSFGVLLSELATCQSPWAHLFATPVQIALSVSSGRLRPTLPSHQPARLQALVRDCCSVDPAARPPFSRIVAELEAIIQEAKANEALGALRSAGGLFGSIKAGMMGSGSLSRLSKSWGS